MNLFVMLIILFAALFIIREVVEANNDVKAKMKKEIEAASKQEPFFKRYQRWKEADEIIKNIPAVEEV